MRKRENIKRKRIVRSICTILILIVLILTGSALYLQWFALQAGGNERGKNIETSYEYMFDTYPFLEEWTDSLHENNAMKDTFITSDDGCRLHAIYMYADSMTSNTAVIVHGYTDNAVRMLHIAYLYNHDLKYNVLLPDLRYAGLSEGNHIQMGWKDRWDVIKWMDVANNIFGRKCGENTDMVVHGISMGAATTMCVSGEDMPEYVNCFVEDCGFTSVWDEYSKELKVQFGMPEFPLLHYSSLLTDIRYGWNFREASPLKRIAECKLPMLFIHGDADTYVPTWMGDSLYAAKKGIKEYWKTPGVEHAASYLKYPKEYTEKVKMFMQKYNH